MSSVELTPERVEAYINEISLGGKLVKVKNYLDKDVVVFVSHCSAIEKLYSEMEYDKSYEKAIDDGFLTVDETMKVLAERGIFTSEDENEIEGLRSKIEGQEKLLAMTTRVPARRDRIKGNIEKYNNRILEIASKRESNLEFCAERKAQEEKFYYLTWRCTKDPYNMELYWPTFKEFQDYRDTILRRNLFIECIKLSVGIDVSIIRFIARHALWRIRYTTCTKTGVDLFNKSLIDYSVDQHAICYWSNFYQSVYEMMPDEKPSEGVIEDDDALDAFMVSYFEEKSREEAEAKGRKSNKGVKSAWDHGETMVMRSNPMYEDIEYTKAKDSALDKKSSQKQDKGKKL